MVDLVQRTDPSEWQVIDELYPSLRRFAAVAAPSDVEPDDLLQEALVRVLAKHPLSELDHPAAYLRKVMINLAASHSRRMGVRRRVLRRWSGSEDLVSQPQYPTDMADLDSLPPRQRAVLYLAEVEGFHYEEIARMLDCSPAAAKKGASRARRRLRTEIVREGLQ
jgi:RNA polymerase sigma-70 factor (ECF subfamily)